MYTKNITTAFTAFTLFIFALTGCKPDTDTCDNCESELITTLDVAVTDSATGAVSHFIFRDLDGDGSNAPVKFDTIRLQANHTYTTKLTVLDESKTPADTISTEIAAEANDHQFFFHVHGISVNFTYLDQDSQNPPMPLGLQTKWQVGNSTGNGHLHITLKHQPGIKDGNDNTGETDLEVEFVAVAQ